MTNITGMLEGTYDNCTLSADCLEVTCVDDSNIGLFRMILLPCFYPPAVRIEFSGSVNYDYIFRQSEIDSIEGTSSRIGVILEHFLSDTVGLEV